MIFFALFSVSVVSWRATENWAIATIENDDDDDDDEFRRRNSDPSNVSVHFLTGFAIRPIQRAKELQTDRQQTR
jgi:hypothetical protein